MEENNTSAEAPKSGSSKTMIIVALVVVLVLAGGVYAYNNTQSAKKSQEVMSEATQPSPTTQVASPTTAAMEKETTTSAYKDGTYAADGHYISPGGEEQIGVSLTIKDGVVTDATVTPKATRPTSVKMQTAFSQGYKPLVVGKNIDDIKLLDAVSGSSLSPKGFNDAVEQIKAQAKA